MYVAYGTVMLLYVMIVSAILSMGLWLLSYNIMWMFMIVGYEISFPWLVFFQFLCQCVCMQVALVPLFFFLFIS